MRQRKLHSPENLNAATGPWLDWTDNALYVLVAILFLVAAIAMGVYSVVHFAENLDGDIPNIVVEFVNDLLLVLIILEVFSTVRSYLATHTTSLKPFLYIGIISATRRILAIGAEMTLSDRQGKAAEQLTPLISNTEFRNRMVDLGINGAVVLALALALFLFSREPAESTDTHTSILDHEKGSDTPVAS